MNEWVTHSAEAWPMIYSLCLARGLSSSLAMYYYILCMCLLVCHCSSCQHLVLSSFVIFVQSRGVKWYHMVVLICIFQITADFEHFLPWISWLAVWVPCSLTCLFMSLVYFSTRVVVFWCWFIGVPCISELYSLITATVSQVANIFSPSVHWCLWCLSLNRNP